MATGLKLGDVITSLYQRGQNRKAERLLQRVKAHFNGIFSEDELLTVNVNDLIGVVQVFNMLYSQLMLQPQRQPRGLEVYIDELTRQGYTVIYGENYRGKR